jgi:hypothetical protein
VSDLTTNQQAALEGPHIKFVFFAEFFFASGTARLSTLNIPCAWGGHEWMGLGTLGDISPVVQSQGTAASSVSFTLSLPRSDWLALSVGPVEEYRGRDAKLYFCPLDENFQLVDTPVRCWSGTMDQMPSSITGKRDSITGSIELKCETSAYGLKRPSALRLNAAQQKQKYPNDTSLDRLSLLIGKAMPWLTVRYQRR